MLEFHKGDLVLLNLLPDLGVDKEVPVIFNTYHTVGQGTVSVQAGNIEVRVTVDRIRADDTVCADHE